MRRSGGEANGVASVEPFFTGFMMVRAWRESAVCEAAVAPRDPFREAARPGDQPPFAVVALRLQARALRGCPFILSGGGSFTPARRAFDNPITIAC